MSKERVETFSDGVFAIILTLLVLELHVPSVPDHASLAQYMQAMAPLVPKIISFVLTFFIIAIHWVGHHYLFRHIRQTPLGIVWLNNILLLWLCFLPFPTAMFGDHPTDQFPILLYSVDSLFAALTFYGLRIYASTHNLFIHDQDSERALSPHHSIPSIILYALAIIFVFVNVYLSLVCLLLIPFLYFIPNFVRTK
jgi:uncharacterized membrane protein